MHFPPNVHKFQVFKKHGNKIHVSWRLSSSNQTDINFIVISAGKRIFLHSNLPQLLCSRQISHKVGETISCLKQIKIR